LSDKTLRERVLVADDDPAILRLVTTILEKEGLTVIGARDGKELYFVAPDEESCKNVHCYYRLLDTKNGIKEVFGFRGTGVIWLILSPVEVPVDFFQDDYSRIGFETPEKTYIGVALPHSGNAVIVEGVPADQLKLLPESCRTGSK